MRQWLVDPKIMCRQHLLGEHLEHHMFVGTIRKGGDLTGFLANNLLEPLSLISRHLALVEEMTHRGYNHRSPLPGFEPFGHEDVVIDRPAALAELLRRCPKCRQRLEVQNGLLQR